MLFLSYWIATILLALCAHIPLLDLRFVHILGFDPTKSKIFILSFQLLGRRGDFHEKNIEGG